MFILSSNYFNILISRSLKFWSTDYQFVLSWILILYLRNFCLLKAPDWFFCVSFYNFHNSYVCCLNLCFILILIHAWSMDQSSFFSHKSVQLSQCHLMKSLSFTVTFTPCLYMRWVLCFVDLFTIMQQLILFSHPVNFCIFLSCSAT